MNDLEARLAKYVGVPFVERGATPAGWDCWGLVHWIAVHELGLDWPSYEEAYASIAAYGGADVVAAFARHMGGWVRLDRVVPGSVVAFDKRGADAPGRPQIFHVGLAIDARRMLHADRNAAGGTVIARLGGQRWGRFFAGAWTRA